VERVDRRSAAPAGAGLIADAILVVHFVIAAFIAGGLVAVWVGAALGWRWVRNRWFRYLHLCAIAFVAAEALLGMACPLTVWEDMLRGGVRAESFIGRWVRRLLFYEAPEWLFAAAYVAWAAATLVTLRLVPPRRRAG
jgi:polyferredoxin